MASDSETVISLLYYILQQLLEELQTYLLPAGTPTSRASEGSVRSGVVAKASTAFSAFTADLPRMTTPDFASDWGACVD